MRISPKLVRWMTMAALATVMLGGVTGCKWFKKGDKGDYALAPEMRPLEVPPDLTRPNTGAAAELPNTASALTTAAPATAPSNTGFRVDAPREEVFAKLEPLLKSTEGLTISSSAPLLSVYDVNYAGSNFLVRVMAVEGGSSVSAVDPRGVAAAGEAPVKLIAILKAALGG